MTTAAWTSSFPALLKRISVMPKPLIIASIALLGAAVGAPASLAQMRGGGFARSVGVSFAGPPRSRSFGPGAIVLGDPFYADNAGAPVIIPPQFVMAQPSMIVDTPPEPKSEPLMIELQGDRYVRIGGRQQSAERGMNATPDYAQAEAGKSSQVIQQPSQPEPPTVLIFRDGHREQVPGYAIVGNTLYANGDYWQSGSWTKNIQISALNIPATIQANHEAGVRFTLPSAPNEVVTRP
jgi:hypothetical protein